jgi:hypothetical protein
MVGARKEPVTELDEQLAAEGKRLVRLCGKCASTDEGYDFAQKAVEEGRAAYSAKLDEPFGWIDILRETPVTTQQMRTAVADGLQRKWDLQDETIQGIFARSFSYVVESIPCELCGTLEQNDEDIIFQGEGAREQPVNEVDAQFAAEGKRLGRICHTCANERPRSGIRAAQKLESSWAKMKKAENNVCPRCLHKVPTDRNPGAYPGALSRVANVEICSSCGKDEVHGLGLVPMDKWPIAPKYHRAPCEAHEVPDLVHELVQGWKSPPWQFAARSQMERMIAMFGNKASSGDINEATTAEIAWEVDSLLQATLWWVGPEMCDLLYATMESVPDDTMVADLVRPAPRGLVILSKPWNGIDAMTGEQTMDIDAVLWGHANLPSVTVDGIAIPDSRRPCISLSSYACIDLDAGMGPQELLYSVSTGMISNAKAASYLGRNKEETAFALHGKIWSPLGRSDWPITDPLKQDLVPGALGAKSYQRSADDDRRFIAALWTLLNTRTVAEVRPHPISRQIRRRAQRNSVPSDVRVIYLRRPDRPNTPDPENPQRPARSHRWYVGAYYAHRWYGKGRTERKLTLVSASVRGPADKPFIAKKEVRKWIR